MTTIITVKGDRELNRYLKGLVGGSKNFGNRAAWMIAQKNAKHIRRATSRFKKPRGNLQDSIKAGRTGDNSYGVSGAYYAFYADAGRRPGRRPPAPRGGKIQRWAGGSQLSGYMMSRAIGRHGTRPTRFITDGIKSAVPDWEKSLKQHLDYFVKSGGRSL